MTGRGQIWKGFQSAQFTESWDMCRPHLKFASQKSPPGMIFLTRYQQGPHRRSKGPSLAESNNYRKFNWLFTASLVKIEIQIAVIKWVPLSLMNYHPSPLWHDTQLFRLSKIWFSREVVFAVLIHKRWSVMPLFCLILAFDKKEEDEKLEEFWSVKRGGGRH